MRYSFNILIFFINIFLSIIWLKIFLNEKKRNKKQNKQINDILNFNINDSEYYDIHCVEKADLQMTSIQKEHYMKNDTPIIIQGKVRNIRNEDNNIEVEIVGDRFSYTTLCRFSKDTNLLNIRVLQPIKVKGYLKPDYFILKLEDCELIN